MKKNCFTLILSLICVSAIAQPAITDSSFNFNVRSTYFVSNGYVNPNPVPPGSNVIWDFSGLTAATEDSVVFSLKTDASDFAAYFPGANEIISEYTFNKNYQIIERHNIKNRNEYVQLGGGYQSNGNFYKYTPARKLMKFPFVFNTTFSDTIRTRVTYDGYGTLILPVGTFTNVYRTHSYDSMNAFSKIHSYNWFDADRRLLTIYDNGTFKDATFYGMPAQSTGVHAISKSLSFNIYPNPGNGNFTLNTPAANGRYVILNAVGQIVESRELEQESTNITLSLKGVYVLTLFAEGQFLTRKIVVE